MGALRAFVQVHDTIHTAEAAAAARARAAAARAPAAAPAATASKKVLWNKNFVAHHFEKFVFYQII